MQWLSASVQPIEDHRTLIVDEWRPLCLNYALSFVIGTCLVAVPAIAVLSQQLLKGIRHTLEGCQEVISFERIVEGR